MRLPYAAAVLLAAAVLAACTTAPAVDVDAAATARASAVTRSLPGPDVDGDVPLTDALTERRSVRSYADTPLTGAQVAQLLWAAQGITADWGGRTAPSAGGIYPLEAYVVAGDEVLHYLPDGHRAQAWRLSGAQQALARAVGQDAVADAPAAFVLTGVVARTAEKYGDRAERYVLLEVGHAAQNLLLQATGLGLGAVTIGAFDDDALAAVLALGEGERPYYVIPVGVPDPDAG